MSDFDALLKENDALVVAFSGGLDSTVLLHQLRAWQQARPQSRLRALHVHHGLSPNADSWAAHCLCLCERWQIPCEVLRVQVTDQGQGIEAAARQVRYQALGQALCADEKLLTAQHLDDQCETLLLALKRGSGPAGLAAMPAATTFAGHALLRPLLNHSRLSLEQYAEAHQLVWVEDESNQDQRYDRNFLRQQLLPTVLRRWPHFAEASARSAALCGEQEQLLDELLAEPLSELIQPDGSLCFTPLLTMSEVKGNALLRRWLAAQGEKMPSREALRRIRQEIMLCREDAQPRLKLGNHEIRRYRQQLYHLPLSASLADCEIAWNDVEQPLHLPQNLGVLTAEKSTSTLRCPQPQEQVFVRFHATGYVHIVNRPGGRDIKKIWQRLNIPPWQRARIPLIYFNQTLICAPGLFVTREGASEDAAGWQVNWQKTTGEPE